MERWNAELLVPRWPLAAGSLPSQSGAQAQVLEPESLSAENALAVVSRSAAHLGCRMKVKIFRPAGKLRSRLPQPRPPAKCVLYGQCHPHVGPGARPAARAVSELGCPAP